MLDQQWQGLKQDPAQLRPEAALHKWLHKPVRAGCWQQHQRVWDRNPALG